MNPARIRDLFTLISPALGRKLGSFRILPRIALGKRYAAYSKFLVANAEAYDNREKLISRVNRSIRNVPHYKRKYGDLSIASIQEFESKIGFIDKDTVVSNERDFVDPEAAVAGFEWLSTAGTSGKPMNILVPKDRYVVELGTMHYLWGKVGYRHHFRAVVRNHHLRDGETYRLDPLTQEVIFDGFNLTPANFRVLTDLVRAWQIPFIHAYPSAAYELGKFMHSEDIKLPSLKAFLSGSENVYNFQVDLIEKTLGVRFYNWYGHTEKLILGGQCAESRDYHMEPTYGYFELIGEDGQPITTPGGFGEIVGTTLHNDGMPLIRYRTGDFATYVGDHCDLCGRRLPVIRDIQGRWSGERIYNSDGSFVTPTALNLHDELYGFIYGLQYVQDRMGSLTIRLVRGEGYSQEHEARILKHYADRFNKDMKIGIEYVNAVDKHKNGKFQLLLSKISRQEPVASPSHSVIRPT